MDEYCSLATVSEGLYREKGSKFLAFAFPVTSEAEVKERLAQLRQRHAGARHHCYAFALNPPEGKEYYRTNDDGEPNHSAGDPILGQLRSQQLLDVLLVVVRYFGGTKLGVGGLVNAYRSAAADAIAHNQVVNKVVTSELSVRFGYAATSAVQRVIHQYDVEIADQVFAERCYFRVRTARRTQDEVTKSFNMISGVTCS